MVFKPHTYQKYCIDKAINNDKLGLFLEMGLGKTIITLTAINELKYNRFEVKKVLVIAPKKVAEATWMKESEKWDHTSQLRIMPILGSKTKRVKALHQKADIYVINRENVYWLVDYYRNSWPFDTVIIDELSSFKSSDSKRFKAMKWIRPRIKRIIGLTGTPAPNGLMDLWAQMYLLDRGERLYERISHYRERYFNKYQLGVGMINKYSEKRGAAEAIREKISDICISLKAKDYIDLPDCIIQDISVVLDNKAQKSYNDLERKMLLQVDTKMIDVASAAALSNKLLQLCNGAVYDEDKNIHKVHECKIEAFMECLEELNGEHAVVFYNFKHDLYRLQAVLAKTKLRVRVYKSVQDQEDWNAGNIDILLAQPQSFCFGLNMQEGGRHIIWFGLNWSLEVYQQSNKRLHRQGQKQTVFIHRLVIQGGRDEDVIAALEDKDATQDTLIESLKARIDKVKLIA